MSEGKGFPDLGISESLLRAVSDMGFEEPTPIQVQAIPLLLAGRDVVGQAQTGTGKTAAFAIPALQLCDFERRGPQALVLEPTRELALQVAEEVARLGVHMGVREAAIYGGQPIERQVRALRSGADVVVGTPGRLLDHLRRGTLRLDAVRFAVLDEGDEMLDMGFIEDIEAILRAMPQARQTVIFSATVPAAVRQLAQRYLNDPVVVRIEPERLAAPSVAQYHYELGGVERSEALCRLLDVEDVARGIVFCRTKRRVDELAAVLQARGYPCEAIHGDMTQPMRLRSLARFREGRAPLLVATDVAARGLDVEGVSHVINYDIPASPEDYVHRIGRTGRAGRSGVALTLVAAREVPLLRQIGRVAQARITRRRLPTATDVALAARDSFRRELLEVLSGDLSGFLELAKELSEERSAVEVAAAAIKMAMQGERAGQPAGGRDGPAALGDRDQSGSRGSREVRGAERRPGGRDGQAPAPGSQRPAAPVRTRASGDGVRGASLTAPRPAAPRPRPAAPRGDGDRGGSSGEG